MKEPQLSQFRKLLNDGAGQQDVHDSSEATGYAVQSQNASDSFIRREVNRVQLHRKSLCPLLEERVGKLNSILDVGCSTGGTTVALALSEILSASEIIGIDPNGLSVQAAELRARGYDLNPERVRFLNTLPNDPLPFADNQFDLTVCVSVLEFISTTQSRMELCRELQRVTKTGGYVFLATPSPFCFFEYHSGRWLGNYIQRAGFPWASSPWQIREMFIQCDRMSLIRQYRQRAKDKFGRGVSWLPDVCFSSMIASPWQKFLFRKNRQPAR